MSRNAQDRWDAGEASYKAERDLDDARLIEQQREQIRRLELALATLACHARDASGNLPPMHDADLHLITKMLGAQR
jgi:hypothetical protein